MTTAEAEVEKVREALLAEIQEEIRVNMVTLGARERELFVMRCRMELLQIQEKHLKAVQWDRVRIAEQI